MSKHRYIEVAGTEEWRGLAMKRIRATRDIPCHGVKAGDLGGLVSKISSICDSAWVTAEAVVCDDAVVAGYALVADNAVVADNTRISGFATVRGASRVSGTARVYGRAVVRGGGCC